MTRRSMGSIQRLAVAASSLAWLAGGCVADGPRVDVRQQAAVFPPEADWVPLPQAGTAMGDVETDGNNNGREVVGNAALPAAFIYSDGTDVFFRLRLDETPERSGGLSPFGWGFLIDTDGNFNAYEFSILIDSTGACDQIVVGQNTAPSNVGDPSDVADTIHWPGSWSTSRPAATSRSWTRARTSRCSTMRGRLVRTPCPISLRLTVIVTLPSALKLMNTLGVNVASSGPAAAAMLSGQRSPSMSTPPAAPVACRNSRRDTLRTVIESLLLPSPLSVNRAEARREHGAERGLLRMICSAKHGLDSSPTSELVGHLVSEWLVLNGAGNPVIRCGPGVTFTHATTEVLETPKEMHSQRLGRGRAKIQAVAMDMSQAYIKAVTEHLPNAQIVFDHFHIIKLFNEKLSDLRRELFREATDKLHKHVLKGTRWLLLMNPEHLDPKRNERQRLEKALELNAPLATAYYLKEDLRQLWQQPNWRTARTYLTSWCARAMDAKIGILQQFARTLRKHARGILNYFKFPISTGPLEGYQ